MNRLEILYLIIKEQFGVRIASIFDEDWRMFRVQQPHGKNKELKGVYEYLKHEILIVENFKDDFKNDIRKYLGIAEDNSKSDGIDLPQG